MKNIFSILLICCATFAFADEQPVFDEADDNECRLYAPIPFAVEAPIFEEDEEEEEVADNEASKEGEDLTYAETCDECGEDGCDCCLEDEEADETTRYCCGDEDEENTDARYWCTDEDKEGTDTRYWCTDEDEENTEARYCCGDEDEENPDARFKKEGEPYALGLPIQRQRFEDTKDDQDKLHSSYSHWSRYKTNFGMEKIFVRFPQKPAMSQSSTLLTAYAYDHAVMYSFAGYFPPVGNIDPIDWFDEILYNVTDYPYNLVSHTIFQVSNGDWVMDYIVHDYVQNLVIKARAVITPFNGYILQCVKPNGTKDYFDYFLDNFWIKCECHH